MYPKNYLIMGFFPLPHRPRSFQGPHMTCLQSAETYANRFRKRTADTRFDFLMERSLLYGHMRFLILFSFGLFTMTAFVLLGSLFLVGYALMQFFLRLQYKLAIFLVMLGRRQLHFDDINKFWLLVLQISLLLIGGFGWIFLLFIET